MDEENRAIDLCLRHHDPAGFEVLVKLYRREAYFHALSVLGNEADAADACQEAFTKAFKGIVRLSELTAFYPWFYRILRNCCLNMISRKKTALEYARTEEPFAQEQRDFAHPAFIAQKRENEALVWAALQALEPDAKEVLALKYFQGKSYREIAECLQIPQGTVMSRLYHARKAFRSQYLALQKEPARKEFSHE